MTSMMKKLTTIDLRGSKLLLLAIVICLTSPDQTEATITDYMPSVVARMWDLVAGRNAIVQAVDLDLFFNRYDPLQPDLLNLYEDEFIGGEVSWTQDFVLQHMTIEFSKAYFRSTDVYLEANIAPYLNFEDMDVLIDICERHAGTGILGYVNEVMFTAGFVEVIYRGVAYSLLFIRYNTYDEVSQRHESLNNTEFQTIFYDIDTDDDLLVSKKEMADFWVLGDYGSEDTGKLLFDKINYINSSHIDLAAWTELQLALDCRDNNLKIDFEEMLQLDLIINDLLTYPGGNCSLNRYLG